ncbi:MAG: non-canonical purine NTP pyrophosphatase [Patescibacteria group bacterium]
MKLLIATTNPGKLNEIRKFLAGNPIEFVSLKDVGITDSVEETGKTFEENAVLKAKYYCKKSGLPTLADDGGFEIDALNGEPGVKSHRWIDSSKESSDEELIAYTIKRMEHVPEGKRVAQLRLVLALALPDGTLKTAEASVRGIVPMNPTGTHSIGFPFRSLLYIPELGKYYNHEELTDEENVVYNHRRKALEQLKPYIMKYLP